MCARLLIADDEKDTLALLQYRLELKGYEIDVCSNGGEALDRILEKPYDLVLMDYFMPILKGDVVCQGIRSEERLQALPIIIITGFSERTEEFFKERGATDVVYKPCDIDEIVAKVTKYIGESVA